MQASNSKEGASSGSVSGGGLTLLTASMASAAVARAKNRRRSVGLSGGVDLNAQKAAQEMEQAVIGY